MGHVLSYSIPMNGITFSQLTVQTEKQEGYCCIIIPEDPRGLRDDPQLRL